MPQPAPVRKWSRDAPFLRGTHLPMKPSFNDVVINCNDHKTHGADRARAGNVMSWLQDRIGRMLARYLEKPATGYEPFTPSDPDALARTLRRGDVLLIEGNNHIAGVIKYLTQSTWSHAALYVGDVMNKADNGEAHVLIEANIGEGVVSAPLSKYLDFHTRVCRPIGLTAEDLETVCRYAIDRIGLDYDLKNIVDLLRYLVPLPIPQRWRRRMMALGSGDPTRIICSALIAQAFEAVRYPILPRVTRIKSRKARRDVLEIRHSSLYAPRDFDISPYFEVVKPTIVFGFNYKEMHWADLPLPPAPREAAHTRSLADAKSRPSKNRLSKRASKRRNGARRRRLRPSIAASVNRVPAR
jgi:cell wall-associated NlpC family hydrolase